MRCNRPLAGSCARILIALPLALSAQDAAGHRESVQEFLARLNAEQKQQFDAASKAYGEKRFADSLILHEQLLKEFPGDAILEKFAAEDEINGGNPASAAERMKPIAKSDSDDWQAAALLARACAESGDGACRDQQMAHLLDLEKRGLVPKQLRDYAVENVKLGDGALLIRSSLVPWGAYNVYAVGRVTDKDGKLVQTITLESGEMEQNLFAKQHPDEAAKGTRLFTLDAYRETGLNSDGQRTQTHYTFKFLTGQPDYAAIRREFIDIASGKTKPVSSRSGLISQ